MIAGFGRKGHVVGDISGVRFKVVKSGCRRNASSPDPVQQVPSGYFDKVGMRYFHRLRNKFHCPIVNVDKLRSMVPQDVKEKSSAYKVPY
ncbi:Ribosomal protein L18e/L15P [Cynara cardunculus var. scolymus]|uniref:Ribosomal protein L18e/L15P n=1 Tax=Cynara cardunculus var. scolymus TaxID=59895 RepID=A0A103Y7E6_CYNCS|nr:Ribosomal protein L18e/L15P [Cynara cardunculus var. scolymus]